MIKTFKAYYNLMEQKWLFWLFTLAVLGFVISSTLFVRSISADIQDSLLSILSILFPLIAGFLTFGRDTMRDLQNNIDEIVRKDAENIGTPTTDTDKRKIANLKNLATNFNKVVIGTFVVSFMLIVCIIVAKFNEYIFQTSKLCLVTNKMEILHFSLKFIFFCLISWMVLNTIYVIAFIVTIIKNDKMVANN